MRKSRGLYIWNDPLFNVDRLACYTGWAKKKAWLLLQWLCLPPANFHKQKLHYRKLATGEYIVSPPNTVCVSALPCKSWSRLYSQLLCIRRIFTIVKNGWNWWTEVVAIRRKFHFSVTQCCPYYLFYYSHSSFVLSATFVPFVCVFSCFSNKLNGHRKQYNIYVQIWSGKKIFGAIETWQKLLGVVWLRSMWFRSLNCENQAQKRENWRNWDHRLIDAIAVWRVNVIPRNWSVNCVQSSCLV